MINSLQTTTAGLSPTQAPVHVAVGVVANDRGEILVTRRPDHVHQGGLWEFPGGKCEPGEGVSEALRRELHEELGIVVERARPLIRNVHDYGDRAVLLDVYRITAWSGRPEGREGQPLAWVDPYGLADYPMPAADRPILTALRLPDRYVITGENPADRASFLAALQRVLAEGERLIQLRARTLPVQDYRSLAGQAASLCHQYGARLLLNSDPELVGQTGADGIHLTSRALGSLVRRPLGEGYLLGASCHNHMELSRAEQIGVDFVVLSPVLRTDSHPQADPMGWDRFRTLVEGVGVPVFALGGMNARDVDQAQGLGGQGVAGISGFWPLPGTLT